MQADVLILNAAQVVTCAGPNGPKRGKAMTDVGLIAGGAVAIADGEIVAVGKSRGLQADYTARNTVDAGGKVVCPGFVDPHTHVVFAGDRVGEFELRLKGATYQEIMAAGGGIVSTTQAVRKAPVAQLVAETRPRLGAMLALGTTTVEIKTGYGLDTNSELKMLKAINQLALTFPADIVPTFLGAHAIPPEFAGQSDAYTDLVVEEMLPQVAEWYRNSSFPRSGVSSSFPRSGVSSSFPRSGVGMHTATLNAERPGLRSHAERGNEGDEEGGTPLFCDVFCEQNAFSVAQSRRVLEAGKKWGMLPKIHVDEFTSLGGVTMAVELGAVSADHLDVTPPEERVLLAGSDAIGVVLPAVNVNLGSSHFANARALVDEGVALALSTDINPGSAPCPSMPLVMAIACRYQKLLPAEAMNAATINAAHAIGLGDKVGSIEVGKQADLLIVDAPDYRHLAYQFGGNLVERVIKRGHILDNN